MDAFEIRPSAVHGQGLFCRKSLEQGEVVSFLSNPDLFCHANDAVMFELGKWIQSPRSDIKKAWKSYLEDSTSKCHFAQEMPYVDLDNYDRKVLAKAFDVKLDKSATENEEVFRHYGSEWLSKSWEVNLMAHHSRGQPLQGPMNDDVSEIIMYLLGPDQWQKVVLQVSMQLRLYCSKTLKEEAMFKIWTNQELKKRKSIQRKLEKNA